MAIHNRDLYFALYQALDSDDGVEPLYRRIPRDFFGLIIIDECPRSGFGKWNEILQHFLDAIQLGMTATPKQSESDEATFLVEGSGDHLTLDQYLDYTRQKVVGHVPDWARLHEVWTDSAKRAPFLEALEAESVHVEVLAQPRADQFDLLAHIAFGKPVHTRDERADAFVNHEQHFLEKHDPQAREVILALLDKYRLGGVAELASADVFRLSPFREMGQAPGIIQRFGGAELLRTALGEMQRRLYRKETA